MDYIHVDLQDCSQNMNAIANVVCGKDYQTRQTVMIENGDFQNERPAIIKVSNKSRIFVGHLDGIMATEAKI